MITDTSRFSIVVSVDVKVSIEALVKLQHEEDSVSMCALTHDRFSTVVSMDVKESMETFLKLQHEEDRVSMCAFSQDTLSPLMLKKDASFMYTLFNRVLEHEKSRADASCMVTKSKDALLNSSNVFMTYNVLMDALFIEIFSKEAFIKSWKEFVTDRLVMDAVIADRFE